MFNTRINLILLNIKYDEIFKDQSTYELIFNGVLLRYFVEHMACTSLKPHFKQKEAVRNSS